MKVRLTRKLAECVDGVDLSNHSVGDVLELSPLEATLLVAEKWAIPERRSGEGASREPERRQTAGYPPKVADGSTLSRA
jgi:hypothetical protein